MQPEPKRCLFCGEPLVRKIRFMNHEQTVCKREELSKFLKRRYCNIYCKNTHVLGILWTDDTYRKRMSWRQLTPEQRLRRREHTLRQWKDGTLRATHLAVKRRTTPNWNGLSDDDVRHIIIDFRTYQEIGRNYQISPTMVGQIKRGTAHQIENRPEPVIIRTGRLRRLISDADIQAIIVDPDSQTTIGKKYNISKSYVGKIKRHEISTLSRGPKS